MLGVDGLRHLADVSPVPVMALGGIAADDAHSCLRAGAAGAAVMGPLMRDPGDVTAFLKSLQ